jgi:hypothetical protein
VTVGGTGNSEGGKQMNVEFWLEITVGNGHVHKYDRIVIKLILKDVDCAAIYWTSGSRCSPAVLFYILALFDDFFQLGSFILSLHRTHFRKCI